MKLTDVQRIVSRFDPETMLTAEPWDEDKTLFRYILYLAARSYQVEQLFQVPAARPENGNRDYVLSPRKERLLPKCIAPGAIPFASEYEWQERDRFLD